ncbi:MAG: hypothetical protein LBS76_01440 [Mycoplasmataceae bacterium]|jgi:hypothetical protein|nr:hypothetical protein [Mycoplasmataceae bacterium]
MLLVNQINLVIYFGPNEDDYANQNNPNNDAYQENLDNHADQENPNNDEYQG